MDRTDHRRLKLNIKGTFKKFWNRFFLKKHVENMGVTVHEFRNPINGSVEMEISGHSEKLWKVINWSKGSDVYVVLNEVIFEFVDVVK